MQKWRKWQRGDKKVQNRESKLLDNLLEGRKNETDMVDVNDKIRSKPVFREELISRAITSRNNELTLEILEVLIINRYG